MESEKKSPKEESTTLEKVKLSIGILSFIVTTILTIGLFVYGNRLASSQWANQKLVEKRIVLYNDIMPLLNDICCYHQQHGNFRKYSPVDIIHKKRELDEIFYTQTVFLGKDFKIEYKKFMDLCFMINQRENRNAKIRTELRNRSEGFNNYHGDEVGDNARWIDKWNDEFTNDSSQKVKIQESYDSLMLFLAKDIGLKND